MTMRLSLHTWTLDTTPLGDALVVIKKTGWDAVELRRLDFERAAQAGQSAEQVLALVRASGLPVACVGVELGWVWAAGEERARLLRVFAEQAARAKALGCTTIMSPVDRGRGDVGEAARSIREVGDIAREHGVRLAVEFNSQCEQLNALRADAGGDGAGRASPDRPPARHLPPRPHRRLAARHRGRAARGDRLRAVQRRAAHRARAGQGARSPAAGAGERAVQGILRRVARRGYAGYASYEAPNPAAWKRPAEDVAREALAATRAVMP